MDLDITVSDVMKHFPLALMEDLLLNHLEEL